MYQNNNSWRPRTPFLDLKQTWGSIESFDEFMICGDVFDLFNYIDKPSDHRRDSSESQYP